MKDKPECITCISSGTIATISLDGYTAQICKKCFDSMSVYEKMILFKKYSRPWEGDTESTAEALVDLHELIRKIAEFNFGVNFEE